MRIRKGNISLIISLIIHCIFILILSPFLIQQFNVTSDDLSLVIFSTVSNIRNKRQLIREPKQIKAIQNTDDRSIVVVRDVSKNSLRILSPKAPIYDEVAPEIVTYTSLNQSDRFPLSNASSGGVDKNVGATIPNYQRSGRSYKGPGPGKKDNKKESILSKTLSELSNINDLDSVEINKALLDIGLFNSDVMPGHGFIGQVYTPDYPLYQIPKFDELTPIYTFATAKIDVSPRDFTSGFPTPKKQKIVENFAILFRCKLALHTPGVYTFELLSDDGAKLYIDGKLVIDNDGIHDPRNRRLSIKLAAGFHPVEIHYFQGPRYQIALQWFYTPPDRPRQIVPPEAIFHPEKPETPQTIRKLRNQLNSIRR
ncbi:hypothetical protein JT359_15170 [Candidatus Poribacteria bacterium]|nr:hypothetical protein [Candidatus Poribacteria bacterium]